MITHILIVGDGTGGIITKKMWARRCIMRSVFNIVSFLYT